MASLNHIEKLKLEKLFIMDTGYVLDFSNSKFERFIKDSVNKNIFDDKYNYKTSSKANRLRAFWDKEPDNIVGKVIYDLLEYYKTTYSNIDYELYQECGEIAARLLGTNTEVNRKEIEDVWNPRMLRVFISHKTENKEIAKKLKDMLFFYWIDSFVPMKI